MLPECIFLPIDVAHLQPSRLCKQDVKREADLTRPLLPRNLSIAARLDDVKKSTSIIELCVTVLYKQHVTVRTNTDQLYSKTLLGSRWIGAIAKGWLYGILNTGDYFFCTSMISTDFEIEDWKFLKGTAKSCTCHRLLPTCGQAEHSAMAAFRALPSKKKYYQL